MIVQEQPNTGVKYLSNLLPDLFCLPEIIIDSYIQDHTSFSQEFDLNKFEAKYCSQNRELGQKRK